MCLWGGYHWGWGWGGGICHFYNPELLYAVEAETQILWPSDAKELTHLKRPWCWERLKAGGKGDDRGWDGWMASPTQWTWVWVNYGSWWWTGRPGVLQSMGSQRVGHNWVTELNWTEHSLGTGVGTLPESAAQAFTELTILETKPPEGKVVSACHPSILTVSFWSVYNVFFRISMAEKVWKAWE